LVYFIDEIYIIISTINEEKQSSPIKDKILLIILLKLYDFKEIIHVKRSKIKTEEINAIYHIFKNFLLRQRGKDCNKDMFSNINKA
jgi:hypothetical protein